MSAFNFQNLQENQIQKPEPKDKEVEKVWDKQMKATRAKIERSLSDARGRYEEGKAYANAKPSTLWKVVKECPPNADGSNRTNEQLAQEEVMVYLKIGLRKQVLFVENGKDIKEVKIPASQLIPALEGFNAMLDAAEANRDSDEGKAFHEAAIVAARPKSRCTHEGMNAWEYSEDEDRWLAVFVEDDDREAAEQNPLIILNALWPTDAEEAEEVA